MLIHMALFWAMAMNNLIPINDIRKQGIDIIGCVQKRLAVKEKGNASDAYMEALSKCPLYSCFWLAPKSFIY